MSVAPEFVGSHVKRFLVRQAGNLENIFLRVHFVPFVVDGFASSTQTAQNRLVLCNRRQHVRRRHISKRRLATLPTSVHAWAAAGPAHTKTTATVPLIPHSRTPGAWERFARDMAGGRRTRSRRR